MEGCVIEGSLTERVSPPLVGTSEVLLVDQVPVALDKHGVGVRKLPGHDVGSELLEFEELESGIFGRRGFPIVGIFTGGPRGAFAADAD